MTSPEPITAPGIHDLTPYTQLSAPKTQKQMKAVGTAMRYRFGADVLYALAGIEILGVHIFDPFGLLTSWADDLSDRANDAMSTALGAQDSANYANALLGSALTSNVVDGVAVKDLFNGAAATDLGANWTRVSGGDWGGSGAWGPSGAGLLVWTKSGGLTRIHYDRYNTELSGDYQVVQFLLSTIPETPVLLDGPPSNTLRARINASQNSYVYVEVRDTVVEIGCYNAGTKYVWDTLTGQTNKPGQVWKLQCGTDDGTGSPDPLEFVVYRNDVEIWRGDDGGHSLYGASYLGVGMATKATYRFFGTDQWVPGRIDVWAAADYTAA